MNETKETNYKAVHLIDLENLYGDGLLTIDAIKKAHEIYDDEVGIQAEDTVLVAAGTQNKRNVLTAWPGAFYLFRPGANGADIALAQYMSEKNLATAYGRAFLASGDGGLAPYLNYLRNKGLDTVVVSRPSALSWKLNGFERIFVPEMKENK